MKRLKDIIFKLLFFPLSVIGFFLILIGCLLIYVFATSLNLGIYASLGYVFLIYIAAAIILFLVLGFKGRFRKNKKLGLKQKKYIKLLTDPILKIKTALYFSLGMNLIYSAVNVILGVLSPSFWFYILAGYYIILSLMRFVLLKFFANHEVGELLLLEHKKSLVCGRVLLALNLALIAVLLMIIYRNKGYEYKGALIFIMGFYTVYITTQSVINIIKYRKNKSPIIFTSKVVSLSAALVSLISLETALISRFYNNTSLIFRNTVLSITGGAVIITVIIMSVYLILHSKTEIKSIKKAGQNL